MNEQTELIASIKSLAADLAVAYSSLRASVCAMQIAEARVLEARVELATAKNTVLMNHADDIKALRAQLRCLESTALIIGGRDGR